MGEGSARKRESERLTMRAILISFFALVLCGCESRHAAQERAREAYVAGQEQALAQTRAQNQRPVVTVHGTVQNPIIPWEEGMTVSRAIVNSVYTGFMNPSIVRVIRNGQIVQEFEGVDLLRGKDMPLDPGDIVVLGN
jgi:hypothetical protein